MLKKYTLIILILPIFLYSQNFLIKNSEVEVLLDSANKKNKEVDHQTSILYSKRAVDISEKKNYLNGIAWGNFYIGQSLEGLNSFNQSLNYLDKAQKKNEELKDYYLEFKIRRLKSKIFSYSKLFKNSLEEQERILEIIPYIDKEKEKLLKAITYEYMGIVYEKMAAAYEKSNKADLNFSYLNTFYFDELDDIFVVHNFINSSAKFNNYYINSNPIKNAEKPFNKVINLTNKYKYPSTSFTYKQKGDFMLANNNLDSALYFYLKSKEISEKTALKWDELPSIYLKISTTCFLLKNKYLSDQHNLKPLKLKDSLKSEKTSVSNNTVDFILSESDEESDEEYNCKNFIPTSIIIILIICLLALYKRKRRKLKNVKYHSSLKEQEFIKEKENIEILHKKNTRVLELKINESFDAIILLAKNNSPEFFTRFQEVYPEIISQLFLINPKLRGSELTLSAYIFLGFNTKEIATFTFRSISTIKNRKHSLRNKLNIPQDETTELWFKNLQNELY